jgi:uncharacterized protein YcaQ
MRAPARAQDLILAHRVKDYRAGDLERLYPRLAMVRQILEPAKSRYAHAQVDGLLWLRPQDESPVAARTQSTTGCGSSRPSTP